MRWLLPLFVAVGLVNGAWYDSAKAPETHRHLQGDISTGRARRQHALRPRAPAQQGKIAVIQVDGGNTLGYVSDSRDYSGGILGIGTKANAYEFSVCRNFRRQLTAQVLVGAQNNIAFSSQAVNYPYLGLASAYDNSNWGPGSFRYGLFGYSSATPPGSSSRQVPNSNGSPSETAVWSYSGDPNVPIQAVWINRDNTSAPVQFTYQSSTDGLVATGDLAAYVRTLGSSLTPDSYNAFFRDNGPLVQLYLVPS